MDGAERRMMRGRPFVLALREEDTQEGLKAAHLREQDGPTRSRLQAPWLPRSGWALALVLAPIVLIAAAMLVAPSAHAAIGEWLQRCGVVLVDRTTVPPPAPPPPGSTTATAHEAGGMVQYVSLDAAQSQTSVRIRVPSWMPAGLEFAGARAFAPGQVRIQYYGPPGGGGDDGPRAVGITETGTPTGGGYVFPAAKAEGVRVYGRAAIYLHGAWGPHGEWNDRADVDTPLWEADGVAYMLQASDAGLSRGEIIRIAESLQ